MSRTAYQIQARVVKPGNSAINSTKVKGVVSDTFEPGYLLTQTVDGRVSTIASPITDASSAVRYVALESYDGVSATDTMAVKEIALDTVFEAQVLSGTAAQTDIGKRCQLVQDVTTGNYAADLTLTRNPSIEIVDVEPVFAPFAKNALSAYNLVHFKVLPALIQAAPAEVAT